MKKFARHFPHYLSLFGVIFVGLLAFLIFSYDRGFQLAILVSVAAAYVAWGFVHHYIHKDLYLSVIIEYAAVALVGLVIVFSLILRS